MNHFMDFDPYPVGERNQMMQPEINSLRPRERPRKAATTSRESYLHLERRRSSVVVCGP
jgi:hypothetical protein